jgi:methionyl-tRNA formyltransferase
MRIVFAGTPEVAVPTLRALVAAGHEVALVITRIDAPVGRKRTMTPSPVAQAAQELGLTVLKTNQITRSQTDAVGALRPDVGVIVAFGALLQPQILAAPAHGWLNIHFSLLPRWRGAAPVQHALLAGDTTTGISIFRLDKGLDTGDLLAQESWPLNASQSAGIVLRSLADAAPQLLIGALEQIDQGSAVFEPQHGASTYAPKLTRGDAKLDFRVAAEELINRWAAVTPEPGAHCMAQGDSLKIIAARSTSDHSQLQLAPSHCQLIDNVVLVGTATGPVELLTVQPSGKSAMSAADWFRGRGGEVVLT